MQKKNAALAVAAILASMLLLAGCPPSLKIADIQKDPGKYMNKQITVGGKVTNSYGVMGMGSSRARMTWYMSPRKTTAFMPSMRRAGRCC